MSKKSRDSRPLCTTKYYIEHVPLDRGGHTKGKYGKYFGTGEKLWRISYDDHRSHEYYDRYVRAPSREAIKADIRKHCREARFPR